MSNKAIYTALLAILIAFWGWMIFIFKGQT